MRTLKIYLETTMFNYYFDEDRDAHADTVTLFDECKAGVFEAFTSTYATGELEAAPAEKRDKMLALIAESKITVLTADEEADVLARRYIAEDALPLGSLADASHIAIATLNDMDIIVSLNFKHIVRNKTIAMTGAINVLLGYRPLAIDTPMGVIDSEKTRYNT